MLINMPNSAIPSKPQTPLSLSFNLPLSKHFSSSSLFSQRLSLFPVAAKRRRYPEIPEELRDGFEEFKRDPYQRPQLSDVLPDDFRPPEPGTPEYNDILEKFLPKRPPPPPREKIFAVVVVGSRQYIVFPGRWIYSFTPRGSKIVLDKVLLVGTKCSTYVGTPIVTNAAVHAVVEEQLLDDNVVAFKYKKKNYRRNISHRQPITRILITGITGFEEYPSSTLEEDAEAKAEAVPS